MARSGWLAGGVGVYGCHGDSWQGSRFLCTPWKTKERAPRPSMRMLPAHMCCVARGRSLTGGHLLLRSQRRLGVRHLLGQVLHVLLQRLDCRPQGQEGRHRARSGMGRTGGKYEPACPRSIKSGCTAKSPGALASQRSRTCCKRSYSAFTLGCRATQPPTPEKS